MGFFTRFFFFITYFLIAVSPAHAAKESPLPIYTGIYTYKDSKQVRHHLLARLSLLKTTTDSYSVMVTYYQGSFESPEYFPTFYRFCTEVSDTQIILNGNKCRRPVASEPPDNSDLDQPHVYLTREIRNGVERIQGPVSDESGKHTGTLILERGFAVPADMRKFEIEPTISGTYDGECTHVTDEMGNPISFLGLAARVRGIEIMATRLGEVQYGSKSIAFEGSIACGRGKSHEFEPCGPFKGIFDFYRGYFFTQRISGGGWTCKQMPAKDAPGERDLFCSPDFVEETTMTGCHYRRRNVDRYIREAFYNRTGEEWPEPPAAATEGHLKFADAIRKQYAAYYPVQLSTDRSESPVPLPVIEVKELESPKAIASPCPLQSYYEGVMQQHLRGSQQYVEMNFRAQPVTRNGKMVCSVDGFLWNHFGRDSQKTVAIPYEFVNQEIDPRADHHVLVSNRRDRAMLFFKRLPDKTWEMHWFSNYFNYYGAAHLAHRIVTKPLEHYVPFIDGNFKEDFYVKTLGEPKPKPLDYRWRALTKQNFHFVETVHSPYARFLIDGNKSRILYYKSGFAGRLTEGFVQRVSYDYSTGTLSFHSGSSIATGRIFSNGLLFKTMSTSTFGRGLPYPDFGLLRMLELDPSHPIQRPFSLVGHLLGIYGDLAP